MHSRLIPLLCMLISPSEYQQIASSDDALFQELLSYCMYTPNEFRAFIFDTLVPLAYSFVLRVKAYDILKANQPRQLIDPFEDIEIQYHPEDQTTSVMYRLKDDTKEEINIDLWVQNTQENGQRDSDEDIHHPSDEQGNTLN